MPSGVYKRREPGEPKPPRVKPVKARIPHKSGGAPIDYADESEPDVHTAEAAHEIAQSLQAHIVPYFRRNRNAAISPELVWRMALLVAGGTAVTVAGVAVGLTANKVKNWLEVGRDHQAEGKLPGFGPGDSPYYEFLLAMNEAKASLEASMGLVITRAAIGGDWKAAAYILEKRAGPRWRQKQEITVSTSPAQKAASMSNEQLLAAVAEMSAEVEAQAEDVPSPFSGSGETGTPD